MKKIGFFLTVCLVSGVVFSACGIGGTKQTELKPLGTENQMKATILPSAQPAVASESTATDIQSLEDDLNNFKIESESFE